MKPRRLTEKMTGQDIANTIIGPLILILALLPALLVLMCVKRGES